MEASDRYGKLGSGEGWFSTQHSVLVGKQMTAKHSMAFGKTKRIRICSSILRRIQESDMCFRIQECDWNVLHGSPTEC